MTTNDPAFLASRLLWVFRRWGDSGDYVRPFEELPVGIAKYLRGRIAIGDEEVAVLACFHDDERWVVLTTRRLVSSQTGNVWSTPNDEIVDVSLEMKDFREAGGKKLVRTLMVRTTAGDAQRLELEAGAPTVGFLNAIKAVAGEQR
jgi:hypothetical protein